MHFKVFTVIILYATLCKELMAVFFKLCVCFFNVVKMIFVCIGCQSAEYAVLIEFYSKLVDILQVESLAPYLVKGRVLSLQDKQNLDAISSKKTAAEFLLSKVSAPLKAGFSNCTVSFYKLLDIAKQHGNADTVKLCDEIEEQIKQLNVEDHGQFKQKVCKHHVYLHLYAHMTYVCA